MELVSIVIPVYNRASFLGEAIASVQAQTYPHLELVIGDDGSTDETLETAEAALKAFSTHPDRTGWVLALPHRGRAGAVRNCCVQNCRGQRVAFLDSDDLWLPQKIERQVLLHREGFRLSHTREEWRRRGRVVSQNKMCHRREGHIFAETLKKCILGPSTVMVEREFFLSSGGFREDLEIAEDYELWLRLCREEKIGYIDEPLTIKRGGHGDQLSEKYGQIEIFRIQGLCDLVEGGAFSPDQEVLAREELSRKCVIYAKGCLKRGKRDEGRRYQALAEALKASPTPPGEPSVARGP